MNRGDWAAIAVAGIEGNAASDMNAIVEFDRGTFERQVAAAPEGPLAGLAIAIKDNICTLEYGTSCGSRILAGYRSPFEATAVARLKQAGAVVACTTNMDEFAMGSSTEHSARGRTLHPIDPSRVPGGSSGGSAALVAAGVVDAALGSDTGGSVRQPAAFCGVVGVKPTYGRVSRYGLVAFASSLDQIGVFGRDVATAGRVLSVISGRDERDATSADTDPLELPAPPRDLNGVTIGLPTEYFTDALDRGVRNVCDRAIAAMRDAGAEIRPVSLPHTDLAIPAYYVIAPAEASSNLARYDGVRYGLRSESAGDVRAMYHATRGAGFGPEVQRRILIGTWVLSAGYYDAYYGKAQVARGLIAADFDAVFAGDVDLLFTPTTPSVAFRAGERVDDPVSMYLADIFTCTVNLAGLPAVSVPIGQYQGLPVGGQLIAPRFREVEMLGAAAVLESLVDPFAEVA